MKVSVATLAILGQSLVACLAHAESLHALPGQHHRRSPGLNIHNTSLVPGSYNISAPALVNSTIDDAERLLAIVIAQQSAYNTYRVANPRRNKYTSKLSQNSNLKGRGDGGDAPQAPVLNQTILAAAALIAERDAARELANGTSAPASKRHYPDVGSNSKRSDSYWLPQMSGNGLAPMGANSSYQVYRDVTDPKFGAKGDGVTDDTNAINAAIAYGGNCGSDCLSSSTKGTLIYFPPGTYLISSPINAYYYSQLVGDANNRPTIKTAASFVGLGAIQTDVYIPGASGAEWYIEQSNFYRQVRNLIIDITSTTTANAAGLHWQVAQATSLFNVWIKASTDSSDSNTQMGMFTENGSGGFMADVLITGGAYGIYGGNQQYTVRNFVIWYQTKACICLLWDWGWTWSNLDLYDAPIGISLLAPQGSSANVAGSIYVMDSTFQDISTGVYAHFNGSGVNSSIITFDNIAVSNVPNMLEYSGGGRVDIPTGDIDYIVVGDLVDNGTYDGSFAYNAPVRQANLTTSSSIVQNTYFTRNRPQYENFAIGNVVSVKNEGAYGDGVHDDTEAIQGIFDYASPDYLIYFPAGSYLISKTIHIHPGTLVTGEVWSQLVATGSFFANASSPQPMLQVGYPGDNGTVEISDMLFTSIGALPGLILVEWNIAAESQGSAGMWDSHFRLGGAYGTEMQVSQCPYKGPLQDQCVAASMMLHLTNSSNGYFENVWAWVADHDIDDANNTMISVVAARGILIESQQGPTWLYGTASEHSILYQYNFASANEVFAGMIQTESPYYQGVSTGESPGPFNSTVGLFSADPLFPDPECNGTSLQCNFAWAVMMQSSTNVTIAGAGLYSWFADYGQDCVDTQDCQQRIVYDDSGNGDLRLWNLITIGSAEMVSALAENIDATAARYTQAESHPYWSAIAGYLDDEADQMLSCDFNDTTGFCQDPPLCDLSQQYATFAALQANLGSIPSECVDFIAMDTLYQVFNASIANYTQVDDGYDSAFGWYVKYMQDLIPTTISNFVGESTSSSINGGPGNEFFQCTCTKGCADTTPQRCPFTYKQLQGLESFTIQYKLINETGYNASLAANGIDPSWVVLGNQHFGATTGCHKGSNYCVVTNYNYQGIPVGSGNYAIANPKTYVEQAIGGLQGNFSFMLQAAQVALNFGSWNGSSDDLLQTYSVPVFLLQQAIANMAQAKELGNEEEKQHKIELIEDILGGVLAVLPFVNEFLPGLEVLKSVISWASLAGGAALSVDAIVANPNSALFDVLGIFLGAVGKSEDVVAEAAATRRGITSDQISDIGSDFADANAEFQDTIREACAL